MKIKHLIFISLLLTLTACGQPEVTADNSTENPTPEEEETTELTLNDVTLEQTSPEGKIIWRVKSNQAKYDEDRQVVLVENPEGELFQEGKSIYNIKALKGEVYQEEKKILLQGDIVADDLENQVLLRGQELEWLPEENLLIIRYNFTGEHEDVIGAAEAAQIFTLDRRMELYGKVVMKVEKPLINLRSEKLVWMMNQGQFITDMPVAIERIEDKEITSRAFADGSGFDLNTKIAILRQNAQVLFSEPPLQISSQEMSWDLDKETIKSPTKVTVLEKEEKIVLQGNKGEGDLQKKTFDLEGNVVGIGEKNGSQLNSDRLTWYFETESFDAEGNVIYRQLDPPFNVVGSKAKGQLKGENVVVT
ncbi:MAG: LPS export ABC transporter periplasmic protein LptC, partial [Okeania sp. SIO2H7]|nr:LPS export ABC transporter periplasmic protein LptC [Okeania sp. SIO2H7]